MKKTLLLFTIIFASVAVFAQQARQSPFSPFHNASQQAEANVNTLVSKWGKSVDYVWSQNAWFNNTVSYYTYDNNANLTKVVSLNASTLDTVTIAHTQYNANNLQTVNTIYRINFLNILELQTADSIFYDAQLRIINRRIWNYYSGQIGNASQQLITYDPQGNRTSSISYNYNTISNTWQISYGSRQNYTYTANNFLKTVALEDWVYQSKRFALRERDSFIVNNVGLPVVAFVNNYDTSGNLSGKYKVDSLSFVGFISPIFNTQSTLRYYKWQKQAGNQWVDSARYTVTIGNFGKKTGIQEVITPTGWRIQFRNIEDYDQNGFPIVNTFEQYQDTSGRLETLYGSKATTTYAANNLDLIEVVNQNYSTWSLPRGWQYSTRYVNSNHRQFTGLLSANQVNPLKIYPNPTSGSFKVDANLGILIIKNAIGQTVYTQELDETNLTITPNLKAGVYVVNVVEERKTVKSAKLVVQ